MMRALLAVATAAAMAAPDPIPLAADPIPMSAVTLTGEWGAQVAANREVLMSLNLSAWACHFTSTANLTACRASGNLWYTYVKVGGANFSAPKLGFLTAGDDARPALMAR